MKIEEIELFDIHPYQADRQKFELVQYDDGKLMKSKIRVQKHGEIFTPKWMVKKMLATPEIQEKIHDIHATFLEPSAGEGAFLTEILHQKLCYVDGISNKNNWEENALWALMSIYGIEYLEDNLIRARQAMLDVLINHYQSFFQKKLGTKKDLYKSASLVVELNVVQGDTLKYRNSSGDLIIFSEWKPIGDNKVLRIPFTYRSLFDNDKEEQLDIFSASGQLNLFEEENNQKEYKIVEVKKVFNKETR